MTHDRDPRHEDPRPAQTAADEVLKEFEDAETDPLHERKRNRRDGESGDATTPNTAAQQDADGE
ncbi:hypothetical protein [Streptomyces sp. NPDC049813]|uniref:hypothetical protein n=1 Tax=Streptomyces sp. NPDC049813 TaxID=3365597 RepID=UPI00378C2C7D